MNTMTAVMKCAPNYRRLLAALPDLSIELERRHVADEVIILEVTITGTHRGPWRGAAGNRQRYADSALRHLYVRCLGEVGGRAHLL